MMAWFRIVLCEIVVVGVTFAAVSYFPGAPKAPSSVIHFLEECFQHNSRTLYLVGLERLPTYESYLALPYPKVVVHSGVSIGTPDESCLIVLYVDCRTRSSMGDTLSMIMRDFTTIFRNGKYVVLVDDAYLSHGSVIIPNELGSFFATYNIVYWCVTGFRHGVMLQYSLYFASTAYTMSRPLSYAPVFDWNRGLLRNTTVKIYGLALPSFPYIYIKKGKFNGIDVKIFVSIMLKIGYILAVRIKEMTDDSESDIAYITGSLHRIYDDVMLTRRHVAVGILPVVYISDITYFCLVAPHIMKNDLTQSLLRPFSYNVWWFIVLCTILISVLNELSKYDTRLGVLLHRIYSRQPVPSFYRICIAVISFVLIESYLATVTSFFLAYRFVPDAKTLDEFFATNTPIRLQEGMDNFLNNIEPRLRDLIVARSVNGTECEEFSSHCAHVDTFSRASFLISENVGVDPVSGRKRSYIVPEMVTRYNCMSYAFARGSPLTDLVAMYLQWMYEAGLMRLYHQEYEQYLQPNVYVHAFEDSLELEHLMSLWICVSIGWGVSCSVFLLEFIHNWLQRTFDTKREL